MATKKKLNTKKAFIELNELSALQEEEMKKYDTKTDEWWQSLEQHQKYAAFYSVVKRISDGETQGLSYRNILYNIFGFGKDAYSLGMSCGFFTLHQMFEPNTREVTKMKIRAAFNACGIDNNKIDWEKINRILYWDSY